MSYLKNKRNRLKTKYSNILLKDFSIVMSDTPTNTIAICNGGLCNGVNQDMILDVFQSFGNIEEVLVVPGKSYSFVKFKNQENSLKAYDKLNGEEIWKEIKGPVYLGYVENVDTSLFEQFKNFENPPDLILIKDFVTEEEEKVILDLVKFDEGEDQNSSQLKHRKVKHYGYEFKYSINNVDLNEPIEKIPRELDFLWERLKKHDVEFVPDQLTINCYEPGQGIPPHVDTHSAFEDGIVSLSLQASIVMEFKNANGVCKKVLLPRRSLCLMLGESRYGWTHGITPRKSDIVLDNDGSIRLQNRETRISLTFRKTRKGECICNYPSLCDSYIRNAQTQTVVSNMKCISLENDTANKLEGSYVHDVYENIASHFSETRHKPWPNVTKFLESFESGSVILDVGCGNGKYFTKQNKWYQIGCDTSSNLMQVCKQQGFECFSCNCLNIPIRDNVVDGCICIAVIHHLTTEERREKAIKEIIRVLKPNGRALIYVWAKNQEKGNTKTSYLKQAGKKVKKSDEVQLIKLQDELVLPVHTNRTNFNYNDLLVPWKLKTKDTKQDSEDCPVFLRFYHVYEDDELKNVSLGLRNVDIVDYYYDQGNWCVVLEKK